MSRKQSSKSSLRQVRASPAIASVSSCSLFEVGATIVILLVYAALLAHPINLTVGDLARHLKNGELVVRHGLIASTNLFSYVQPDYPFINHHWGSSAIFYLIERIAGFRGLSLVFIALSVLTVWLFLNLAVRHSSFPIAGLLAMICLPILITRYEIRPEMFTYLLSGLYLQILWGYRQRRLSYRALYWLPLLQIFWVNLHIYFFIGILLVALFLFEALVEQLTHSSTELQTQSVRLAAILLLTLLASCVNPAGISGALYPLFIMKGYEFPVLENYSVLSILSVGYNFLPLTYFLIIQGVLALSWLYACGRERSSLSSANLLLSVMVAALAWWAIRNFVLFAYFSMPLAAANLRGFTAKRAMGFLWTRVRICLVLTGVAAVLFFISPIYFLGGGRGAFGIGLKEGSRTAGEFLNRENLQGPIFNNFDVGGYLTYYLYPKQRVFVDNRPEAYPPLFFTNEYFPLEQDEDYWKRRSHDYGFNIIVFNHRDHSGASQQFIVRRVLDPAWAPVFFDNDIIILVKRYGPNQATVNRYELAREDVLTSSN